MGGEIIKKSFGMNLRAARKSLNYNLAGFSKELNISHSKLSRIETGKIFVTADILYKLHNNFKIDIVELFNFKRK
jgi:transcriptional regulator with XRE-family HTH domain